MGKIWFDKVPDIIFIMAYNYPAFLAIVPEAIIGTLYYPLNDCSIYEQSVSVIGNTVNFYVVSDNYSRAEYQSNYLGTTYYYVGI